MLLFSYSGKPKGKIIQLEKKVERIPELEEKAAQVIELERHLTELEGKFEEFTKKKDLDENKSVEDVVDLVDEYGESNYNHDYIPWYESSSMSDSYGCLPHFQAPHESPVTMYCPSYQPVHQPLRPSTRHNVPTTVPPPPSISPAAQKQHPPPCLTIQHQTANALPSSTIDKRVLVSSAIVLSNIQIPVLPCKLIPAQTCTFTGCFALK